jgi:hypothetical protein
VALTEILNAKSTQTQPFQPNLRSYIISLFVPEIFLMFATSQ